MPSIKVIFTALSLCFLVSSSYAQCPGDLDSNATITSATGSCSYSNGGLVTQGFNLGIQTLTIEAGATLNINDNFEVADIINVYGTMIVTGTMLVNLGASVYVADGGYVHVQGDYYNGGLVFSGTSSVDGTMIVDGDFTNLANGTVNVGESGSLQTGSFTNVGGDVNVASGDTDCATNGCCGDCTTLPVTLLEFKVSSDEFGALLSWTTTEELDNDYFEVQKMSFSDSEFKAIGWVTGNGTTELQNSYTFYDHSFTEDSYYRIIQVDFDGTTEIFGPLSITSADTGIPVITIYPNPTYGKVQVNGKGYTGFSIHDSKGSLICKESNRMGKDAQEIINEVLDNKKGLFIITFYGSKGRFTERLIKN